MGFEKLTSNPFSGAKGQRMKFNELPVTSSKNSHGHTILTSFGTSNASEYSLIGKEGKVIGEMVRGACFAGSREGVRGNRDITHIRVHLNKSIIPVFSHHVKLADREEFLKTYFRLGQEHGTFSVSQDIDACINNGYVDVPVRETSEQRVYLMLCYVRHTYEDFPLMENLVNLCSHEIPFWLAYAYCNKMNSIGPGHSVFPFCRGYPAGPPAFTAPVLAANIFGAIAFFNTDMEERLGEFGYKKIGSWKSQPLYQNFLAKKPVRFPLDAYIGKGVLSYCMEKLEETSSPVEEALSVPTGG